MSERQRGITLNNWKEETEWSGVKHAFSTCSVTRIQIGEIQQITFSDHYETCHVSARTHELPHIQISTLGTVIFIIFCPKIILVINYFFSPNFSLLLKQKQFPLGQFLFASAQRIWLLISPAFSKENGKGLISRFEWKTWRNWTHGLAWECRKIGEHQADCNWSNDQRFAMGDAMGDDCYEK